MNQWLHVPDALRIFVDAAVAAEEAHTGYRGDRLLDPLLLVAVGIIYQVMRLDIAVEIIRHQIVIAVVADSRNHGAKVVRSAESALLNLLEDLLKVTVDGVGSISVRVTQVFDILGQGTEQENVVLTNFTSNLNLYCILAM